VLLHGVAFGPESFASLTRDRSGSPQLIVPHRRGYGQSAHLPPPGDLDEQVADIVATIEVLVDTPVVVAGVSGGATLALALTLAHPELVRRLVVHEPAIGPLGSGLMAILTSSATAFTGASSPRIPATALARALAGEATWQRIPDAAESVARVAATMAVEVPHFAAFAPTIAELGRLRALPVLSCVGRDSGPERYEVSRALIACAGAVEVALPSGHLVQVEAPAAFVTALDMAVGPA
jgi:pimeloyl-ACP methyl ester carboxylesterase